MVGVLQGRPATRKHSTIDMDILLRSLGLQGTTNPTKCLNLGADLSPFPFEHDILLVSISVGNAYKIDADHGEINPAILGCATLDTRDIRNQTPGANGGHWIESIRSCTYKILGRQAGDGAEALTADCKTNQVKDIDIVEICQWLRTGHEPGRTERRHVVLLCDSIPDIVLLEYELRHKFTEMPEVIKVVCVPMLYNQARSADCPTAVTLAEVCADLGISGTHTVDVNGAAEMLIVATLVIALKAALPAVRPVVSRRLERIAATLGPRRWDRSWHGVQTAPPERLPLNILTPKDDAMVLVRLLLQKCHAVARPM
ncbi:hypothetical protein LTR49_021759 [Elasticomyces elasticus]|nr:hypothetical protein LTR49_021759 [Elasticomyces elasticus]